MFISIIVEIILTDPKIFIIIYFSQLNIITIYPWNGNYYKYRLLSQFDNDDAILFRGILTWSVSLLINNIISAIMLF